MFREQKAFHLFINKNTLFLEILIFFIKTCHTKLHDYYMKLMVIYITLYMMNKSDFHIKHILYINIILYLKMLIR